MARDPLHKARQALNLRVVFRGLLTQFVKFPALLITSVLLDDRRPYPRRPVTRLGHLLEDLLGGFV